MLEKTSADPLFMQDAASKAAGLLRTVGNEHRLLMLCLLIEHEELTVGELLQYVDLSQSAVSQHLARMRDEGIVDVRRNGLNMYYRIVNPNVKVLVAALKDIFCP
ncbi:ArsR/SmtB family transcription factor [Allopusillimonas ginsengisoli]|uniref:ArsR/SmtB family transcription factor n=1 Tax=Allopusillimonas ginsengisoli TaxID=453575 RepID=UPI0010C17E77|nr:helix-turn-helix transcriptional regulator [Alcaligenaceae bacterium]TKR56372.1 helix-turn-helix transcriptional regulator [Allopusillimonas ginsengisoli]